jgi:autotransporter-associated beta strand protein
MSRFQTNLGTSMRTLLYGCTTCALLAMIIGARGASGTWTGLGADSLWTTTGNWSASPVPGAGDTATFNGAGNGKTSITTAPASLTAYLFDSASCAAYTISAASTSWAVPSGGGITINSTVTTDQNLSGIQFVRPNSTSAVFINQGAGWLKLGTLFANSTQAVLEFKPSASSPGLEVISGKTIDDATSPTRKMSLLLNDDGMLKISGEGNFSGTDADGNTVTLRRGTLSISKVNNVADTGRSGIGRVGRIQFGEAGQTRTATLQYTATTSQSTDRPFYIIDNNTARFDISQATGNLTLVTNITQSAATLGGGNLTKIGLGTLTLAGTNFHTGDTLVSAGTLVVSNNFALNNSAFDTSGAGTLSVAAAVTSPAFGGLKGSTALTLPTTVTSLTLNPSSGKTLVYNGTLSGGTSLGLIKTGAGTQTLGGSNSFGTNVTISAGTLKLAHSHALGTNSIGLLMQGTGRVLQLSGGITLGTNITLHLSSSSADQGGVVNVDGDNEIQGRVNFTTGNAALNIFSVAGTLTLSGNINLSATTRTLYFAGTSLGNNTVSGPITESGGVLPVVKQGVGKWIFSGTNTYSGNTTVNGGTLALTDNAQLKFVIGANGVNNQINGNGTGTLTLDGDFNLDLTGANTTIGNSWTLVDVANVTESFGPTFSVTSSLGAFSENANVWTRQDGAHKLWKFTEATGVLSLELTNVAPVAQAITLGARAGVITTLAIIGGKHNPTDVDGDTVTLQSVAYTSGNGATVAVNGGNVEYTAASSFSGTDSFNYTVSDGFGGTDTRTVTVTVTSANAVSLNLVYGPTTDGGDFVARFAGVPGTTYTVETNGSLVTPVWGKFNNYTAPTEVDAHPFGVGVFEVRKAVAGESSLYFRTIHPSY